jgi:O-antigen/teichoic acid export membrane protein
LISQISFGSSTLNGLVFLTAVGAAFTILTVPLRQYMQFERLAGPYVILTAGSTVLLLVVTVGFVAWLGRGVAGFVEATLIGQATTWLVFTVLVLRRVRIAFSRRRAWQMLSLGLPLVPAFGSLFLLQHGTKYLLQEYRGLGDVGVYTVGLNIGLTISVLVTAFQGAWVPFFMAFANKWEAAREELGRITTYYVLGFGTLSLALFVAAKPAIMLLTEPGFHEAWQVVGITGTTQLLNGLFIVLLPGMYFAKEVRYVLPLQSAAAAVSLGVAIPLIRAYGFVGASLALLLGYATLVTLQFRLNRARGYIDVHYEWFRLRRFAAGYVAVAMLTLVPRDWSLAQEVFATVIGVLLLAIMLWAQLTMRERLMIRTLTQQMELARAFRGSRSSAR